MSTWTAGRTYDYYGVPLVCARRWFDGALEMVDLRHARAATRDGDPPPQIFSRSARALAPCVKPRVTETLGGVTRPETCPHERYARVVANAGPHSGAECCEACGAPSVPSAPVIP